MWQTHTHTHREIEHELPAANIILCGDFSQLSDDIMCVRTGLISVIKQPMHGEHILDRIYTSAPNYTVVRVVTSVVRSDHKAVVAYSDHNSQPVLTG